MKWSLYSPCTDSCHTNCFLVCRLDANQAGNCCSGQCTYDTCLLCQGELKLNSTRCECVQNKNRLESQCRHSYTSNQKLGQDVDKCLLQPPLCNNNCTNTNGSFYCWCRSGHRLDTTDNKTCHDINECENSSLCDQLGKLRKAWTKGKYP